MFTFTALLGAQSTSAASQSLLELDNGAKVLVDVGWDENFDISTLDALQDHVSTLSIVLLTHPTIGHIGAYAHCCKHIPNFAHVPCYATTPVINLGRTLLTDLYASAPLVASIIPSAAITGSTDASTSNLLLQPPTSEEIATYFSRINPLKYSQPHQPVPSPLSAPLNNLTITAYSAGHTLGGTIWHIQHELESIVYAVDWNQGRENLLTGAAWLSTTSGGAEIIEPLRRPTAFICSSKGVEKPASESLTRRKRDDLLISLIRETIAQGGKVLIPTDSSARVLEFAFVLEQTWRENTDGPHATIYKNTRIYMASRTASNTVKYLPTMLDFMDENVTQEAEAAMAAKGNSNDPLDWRHVRQIERKTQLERIMKRRRPCIMLASDTSLEWGWSRQLLEHISSDPKNLVILTEDLTSGLASQLRELYKSGPSHNSTQHNAKVVNGNGIVVQLKEPTVMPLNDAESALYEQYLTRQRQLYSTRQGDNTLADTNGTDLGEQEAEESSDEEEDEDAEHQGRTLNLSAQMNNQNRRKMAASESDLGVNILLRSKTVHDYDVRNKRGKDKMFPYAVHKHREDEFGELIRAEDFLRAEERDEIDGNDPRSANLEKSRIGIGQKRKWDDVTKAGVTNGGKAGKGGKGRSKKAKAEDGPARHEPDDIDAAIARATGETLLGQGTNGNADESSSSSEEDSDYEPEDIAQSGPQKVVFDTRALSLNCRIAYIDFMGLHEKRDLEMLIPLIKPRKLIVIGGNASESATLAADCRQLLASDAVGSTTSEVFVPENGDSVDASVDTNAWNVKLSREFVKKLTWQDVKGLRIVAFSGRLNAEAVEDDITKLSELDLNEAKSRKLKRMKIEDEGETKAIDVDAAEKPPIAVSSIPILDLPSSNTASVLAASQRAAQPVHVGDLRLADLRRILQSTGHTAEFRGEGTLLIDGTVIVRKSATGRVEVEAGQGGLSAPHYRPRDGEGSFWAVRKAIYAGLAVVAGV